MPGRRLGSGRVAKFLFVLSFNQIPPEGKMNSAADTGAVNPRDFSVAASKDYIGPYRLLKLVRSGQATQIWEAINPTENKRIALKSLHGSYINDKNEIACLRHEYAAGSTLDHPAVNRVYEFNIARGTPYVVMDFFDSPNLKQLLRDDPDRLRKFHQEIVWQAADGLHHVHECGWVHRDVKPDNFLLDEKGQLKLIDFAISQKIRKKGWFSRKQAVQGTRSYMAPEQIRGEFVDARADIYGLGCTLFELFTGRLPYTGVNADELLQKHLTAPVPSISSHNRNVTPDFAKLVIRMMAKNPDKRFDSMWKFREQYDKTRVYKTSRSMP